MLYYGRGHADSLFDRVRPLQWRPLNAHRSFCCIPGSPLDRELIVCASTHPLSLIITCRRISRNASSKVSQSYSVLAIFTGYRYVQQRRTVDFFIFNSRRGGKNSLLAPFIYLSFLLGKNFQNFINFYLLIFSRWRVQFLDLDQWKYFRQMNDQITRKLSTLISEFRNFVISPTCPSPPTWIFKLKFSF